MARTARPIRMTATVAISGGTTEDAAFASGDIGGHRQDCYIDILAVWVIEAVAPSGSATTYDVALSEESGWADEDINERFLDTGNAVGAPVKVVPTQPIRARLDANGLLHARVSLDASDTATYTVQVDANLVGRG